MPTSTLSDSWPCLYLFKSATVSLGRVLRLGPICQLCAKARVIVVKCKPPQYQWSFCRGLFGYFGLAIRDILALYCGRASCYNVKVRVDKVKADVQMCFEGLMLCIARPCHGVQALLQPCALTSVQVLGLKSYWRAFQMVAPVLVYQLLVWCMLAKASLRLPSWLPTDLHQEPTRTKFKLGKLASAQCSVTIVFKNL